MNELQLQKAEQLLRQEFGENWRTIAQVLGTDDLCKRVGKELTSFIAFPERGIGGNNKWRGNCSPKVVEAVARYVMDCKQYYRNNVSQFTLLDPMSGSGSSKAAADSLGTKSILYDLNPAPASGKGGWNALRDEVDDSADLIFLHPPYHDIIRYSGEMWGAPHPDDLSRCESYHDFMDKLNFIVKKLFLALRKDGRLAILVGDIRSRGNFYSMQRDLMGIGKLEATITKAQFNCVSDNRTYKKPFIPIVTETLLLFHKPDALLFDFTVKKNGSFNVMLQDTQVLTWHHLIRMTMETLGGRAKCSDLYVLLAGHPKAQNNEHFKERIRATIYEHKSEYLSDGDGCWRLAYEVA